MSNRKSLAKEKKMGSLKYVPTGRFHGPLSEKMEDELLLAIKKGQSDAGECWAELVKRGWNDQWIMRSTGKVG